MAPGETSKNIKVKSIQVKYNIISLLCLSGVENKSFKLTRD